MAVRWIGQLVEPPRAVLTTMAFSNASRVRIRDGRRSSCTISTTRRPVRWLICSRSRYGAGIDAHPGIDIPNASARQFMESAVPMVLQCPTLGEDAATDSINSSYEISPAAKALRPSHSIVPEPARSPSCHPSSIGPPLRTIAGISTVAAAIKQAGVVLSQPVVRITPSKG